MQDNIYYTIQGDTWDIISYKVYGTSNYPNELIRSNSEHIDTVIFDQNIPIVIPQIIEDVDEEDKMPWE